MNGSIRSTAVSYAVGWVVVGMVVLGSSEAWAQQKSGGLKQQILGSWSLISLYNEEQGVKSYPYGEKPVGLFVFDRSGYVSQFLWKPDLAKFAFPNRLKGTDKEYREVMQGMLSGFGTYTVEGDSVIIKWVASSYPNRAGTAEKRVYKIVGDELDGMNPTAASGGSSHAKYVRAK
jgi:hypothetical protein